MKIIYKISLTLIVLVLSSTSCKKIIDEDINKDPNNPLDVPMNLLLPSSQAGMAYSFGSDLGRFPSLFVQSFSGLANQHLLFDNYTLTESDVNNMWYYNMYGNAMSNLKVLMDKAATLNSPHYGGVAKVLMANSLGVMTDLWGDIPYSQAFKGLDNLAPAFDTQEEIYNTIQSLLTSAIADLSAPTSVFAPADDDLIYNGDVNMWKQAAYSLSARYWLHLGKKLGNVAYTNAIAAIDSGAFSNGTSNMKFIFGGDATHASPIYQFFFDARFGDAGMGKFLIDLLKNSADPRIDPIAELATKNDTDYYYNGAAPGAGAGDSAVSNVGLFYGNLNSPVLFISFAEVKFIRAEAQFQLGNTAEAATNYNEGVLASLEYFGVTGDSTFLANNAGETSATVTLSKIITQKYIANFTLGYEQWTDWRRTNLPVLGLAANAQTSEIPRRFPYPNSERLYNGANTDAAAARQGGATLTNKVWWDN